MKKALSLMMVLVMSWSLVGCSLSGEAKEIELTKSNILDYVTISGRYMDFRTDYTVYEGEYVEFLKVDFEFETEPVVEGRFEDVKIDCIIYIGNAGDSWMAYWPEEYANSEGGYIEVSLELPANGKFEERVELLEVDALIPYFSKDDIKILSVSGTFIKD